MRRKDPRYHSYSRENARTFFGGATRRESSYALTQPYGRAYSRTEGSLWGVNSEGIPLKKYQLSASTKRGLSVSLPFSEFFVNVFFSTSNSIS